MENNFDFIENDSKKLDFNQVFAEGWDVFKKNAGSYIGYFVLTVFSAIIWVWFVWIPYIGWGIPFALMAGFYTFASASKKGDTSFGNFFNGFQHYWQVCNYTILYGLIISIPFFLLTLLIIPWDLYQDIIDTVADGDWQSIQYSLARLQSGSTIMFYVFSYGIQLLQVAASVFLALSLPLIVDQKISAPKAISVSFRAVRKNYWVILAVFVLFAVAQQIVARIMCVNLLAVFFLTPLLYCMTFGIYYLIFSRTKDTSEIDSFGTNEPDINTESDEDNVNN